MNNSNYDSKETYNCQIKIFQTKNNYNNKFPKLKIKNYLI